MGRPHSDCLTLVAVVSLFAAIAFPIAGSLRDGLGFSRGLSLLLALPVAAVVMAVLWCVLSLLIDFLMRDKNPKIKP